jgi:acetylcholinesterase
MAGPLGTDPALLRGILNNPPAEEAETTCLTVNVFAPAAYGVGARRPVLVFIPGGGFQLGTALSYDGTPFAAYEDIIVVSMNYRTNGNYSPKSTTMCRLC